jgi:glycosyltransferase involved in cell wall biosynthesis
MVRCRAQSMRIAIDARYIREKPSGIGTYVQALVDRLPAAAPSDQFLFWAHPLAGRPLSPSANTREVVVTPGPNSPLPVWWPAHYVAFDGVDVFHSPHNMMPRGVSVPSVVTVHDVMAIERPDLHLHGLERVVKSAYYPQAVWRALREATRIITPTKDVASRVCRLEPSAASRVRVILEAADPVFRPPADAGLAHQRACELTGSTDPYLLVVGANSATKRHADAVAAFSAVPAPWRLVLLQRQGADARLARVARQSGTGDRIVWLPRVERADVVALMQSAGALIQPSVYEGFGLPIVEAMACGCPVVVSDIPVFREVTDGHAVFARPLDPADLGAALQRVTTSESLRSELRAAGLERASQLSWDRCALETVRVYREAASAGDVSTLWAGVWSA